jgi:hypothetical protein
MRGVFPVFFWAHAGTSIARQAATLGPCSSNGIVARSQFQLGVFARRVQQTAWASLRKAFGCTGARPASGMSEIPDRSHTPSVD